MLKVDFWLWVKSFPSIGEISTILGYLYRDIQFLALSAFDVQGAFLYFFLFIYLLINFFFVFCSLFTFVISRLLRITVVKLLSCTYSVMPITHYLSLSCILCMPCNEEFCRTQLISLLPVGNILKYTHAYHVYKYMYSCMFLINRTSNRGATSVSLLTK